MRKIFCFIFYIILLNLCSCEYFYFLSRDEWLNKNNYHSDDTTDDFTIPTSSFFTVIYVGNSNSGGTVPVDSTSYSPGDLVTVLTNTGNLICIPSAGTAEAFEYEGWNTQANGSGIHYSAGSGTFNITANITLYAEWGAYEFGDTGPAGGIIFYDKGNFTDNWRYIEALPTEISDRIWSDALGLAGTNTGYGMGKINTSNISGQFGYTMCAAYDCTMVNYNGFNDWYLPSLDELSSMYNLKIAGLSSFINAQYWSSSEVDPDNVECVNFTNNIPSTLSKINTCHIRPCRQF